MNVPSSHSYVESIYYWSIFPFVLQEALYWLVAAIFTVSDYYLSSTSPKLSAANTVDSSPLSQQKIQHDSPIHTLDWSHYHDAITISMRNHLCGSLPTMIFFGHCYTIHQCPLYDDPLPSFYELLYQIIGILLVEEIGFYYLHRLFHENKYLYQSMHQYHHHWHRPVSVAATDCHLIEHILINVSPVSLGPLLVRAHYYVWFIWCSITVMNTLSVHSGFKWSILRAKRHDRHHQYKVCNYGVLGLLDRLHGTAYKHINSKEQ